VACQHSTSRRRVGSDGGSEAIGARGEPGAGGVPLTIPLLLDEHRLDAEESEIGQKGIEPKVRARMRRGAPGSWCGTPLPFLGRG